MSKSELDRLLDEMAATSPPLPAELAKKPFTTLRDLQARYDAIRNCGREVPLIVYVEHSVKPTTLH